MAQSDPHSDRGHAEETVATTTPEITTAEDLGNRAAGRTADLYASFEQDRRKDRFERAVEKGRTY